MDDPLVINPVPSKATVNPQIDSTITTPKQRDKLNTSFNSFFEEIDSHPPTAEELRTESKEPEEPKEEPKAEEAEKKEEPTKEPEVPEVKDVKEPESKGEVQEPEKKVESKVDLDSLEAHPASSEENKGHFAKLKSAAKELREKNKAWEKISPALQELGFSVSDNPEELSKVLSEATEKIRSLKNGAIAPEILTELESLRGLARSVGVLQSEEFTRDYVTPVNTAYNDVIQEMSKYFDASEDEIKSKFLDPLKKFKVSELPPEWWEQQSDLMVKAPVPVKRKIEQKIANVLLLQEKHDLKARELSENKLSYADWNKKTQEEGAKVYESCIRDEVEKVRKEDPMVEAFMPKTLEGITDPKQLDSIKKINEKFPERERVFQSVIRDFNSGPRAAARRALEFVKATEGLSEAKDKLATKDEEVAGLIEKHESEVKSLKEDNERLRDEVTKKRRLSDAPLKPSAGGNGTKATPEKKKAPLDGRKSLGDAFADWKL